MDYQLAVCLDGIHMKEDGRIPAVDQGRNLFYGFYGSHFIVHIHDGNQDGIRPYGCFQLL